MMGPMMSVKPSVAMLVLLRVAFIAAMVAHGASFYPHFREF